MKYYAVRDKDSTPQRFPLGALLARVQEVVGADDADLVIERCSGYGRRVGAWADDPRTFVPVSVADLADVSRGTDEWFHDVAIRYVTPAAVVQFGLHDSTLMFVQAPAPLADAIVASFSDVTAHEQPLVRP